MIRLALAFALIPLAASAADDGWPLTLVDGVAPGYTATLALDQPGKVYGRAPCNRYSGPRLDDLPVFRVEAVMSTKMACPEIEAEQAFFDLLTLMDHAEQGDGVLTLTGGGRSMVFSRLP